MSDDIPSGWLDAKTTAEYLQISTSALPDLVREGRIPEPSYALGPRSPRWNSVELLQRIRQRAH